MAVACAVLVWALRDLVLLVGYSVLLAYALLPVVRAIERLHDWRGRRPPRALVAGVVMTLLVALVTLGMVLVVPPVAFEVARLAAHTPEAAAVVLTAVREWASRRGLDGWVDPALEALRNELTAWPETLRGPLARGAENMLGAAGHLAGLFLMPLLSFYLLAESKAVQRSAMDFIPETSRAITARFGAAVDRALRSYVRGQAIVCVVTGAAVCAGLALLHHPYALLLGLLAGAAELIPYVGFLVATGAIAIAGAGTSPVQAGLGVGCYVAINWAIGTFVTPRLMGRHLRMHPFVVTVSVLAGARLLGAEGALLAIPVAAALQAVISELTPGAAARRSAESMSPAGP